MIILLLCLLPSLHEAAFPSSFGGCPSPPPPSSIKQQLDPTNLPPSITRVFHSSKDMIDLVVKNGIDLVDSGLWTTPTSAMSIGIVHGQELIWTHGVGTRNASSGDSDVVDENTIYRVGSISKIFAMLSMMKARDQGKLSLDDPIAKHVPEFSVKPPPGASGQVHPRGVTFAQLASHMGGMTRESPCDNQPCVMENKEAWRRIALTQQILPSGR